MARGCDLGFGWMDSQPASKPVSHTRHIRHAGHAAITAKVTALRINFSGTLSKNPASLQLRYLQTLLELGADQNSGSIDMNVGGPWCGMGVRG